jgi:hypothetical protein
MRRGTAVCLILIVLLLVSFFSIETLFEAADSSCSSEFSVATEPVDELSWTPGEPFPIVDGRIIFPPSTPALTSYDTHWYAGGIYPAPFADQNARTISTTIMIPPASSLPDEFCYVLLSAFDSNGSYNQIGFSSYYGTWGLTYSWTSGPPHNPTYNFNANAMNLSIGVTYTFDITTQAGISCFAAYQSSNLVWSLDAPTGGNYLILSNYYTPGRRAREPYNYASYEEVYQISTLGGAPAFNFHFCNNYWISLAGNHNPATWTSWYSSDAPYEIPNDVNVVISGDSILIDNGAPLPSTNLIGNSGFESLLQGWSVSEGTASYVSDITNSHIGQYCTKGQELGEYSLGRLYQDVTKLATVGKKYKIGGWIRTSSVTSLTPPLGVVIALDYVNAKGWTYAGGYVKEVGNVLGTTGWIYYESAVFTLPPMPTDAVALWFLFDFNNAKGMAWFDDVFLAEIDEPLLSNGYVTPISGDTSTVFSYYVTYHGGLAPLRKDLYIDDRPPVTMELDSGSIDRYKSTLTLLDTATSL